MTPSQRSCYRLLRLMSVPDSIVSIAKMPKKDATNESYKDHYRILEKHGLIEVLKGSRVLVKKDKIIY